MPTLHYKYKMNEPFLAGESGMYQVSHEQNEFKKKFVYGLEGSLPQDASMKTQEETLREFKHELGEQLRSEFAGKPAPDVDSFMIKGQD